ncbi:glycosyltransferase family 9 protein [Candidatus Babeliales bacterium]|nr:glycosyltransferase family 9 protein [Candidatus Babeliales bacterium]
MSYSVPPHLSREKLKNLDKILFITHLGLGDFTYYNQFFKKLASEYPNLKIDILVDDVRRTRLFWRWKNIKRNTISEWVEECFHFNKIYSKTYRWKFFKETLQKIKNEKYSVVVSLCIVRTHKYANWSRFVSPDGYIIGIKSRKHNLKKYFDAELSNSFEQPISDWHVSDLYAQWFELIFGLKLEDKNKNLQIDIPAKWLGYGAKVFQEFGIEKENQKYTAIFVNCFAKNRKRCWPLIKVKRLILELINNKSFCNTCFLVNTPPGTEREVKKVLDIIPNVFFIQAKDNFFQLPSVIKKCNLVISVETSIMHFAAVFNVPVITLMRKKNPEWVPFNQNMNIFVSKREAWVKDITVQKVLNQVNKFNG